MSVVSVNELAKREGTQNNLWQRTYKRVFAVECDSYADGPAVAQQASGVPNIGASYYVNATESDSGSFCTDRSCAQTSGSANPGHARFEVTCNYGPYSPLPQNPTEWPLQLEWGGVPYRKTLVKDVDGDEIRNSAKDPFKEPIEVDDSRTSFSVKRNEKTFDPYLADSYRDSLNLAEFCGFAAKTVKCCAISSSLRYNADVGGDGYYNDVTYEFQVNYNGWDRDILDQGYSYLDGSGDRMTILTADGQKPTEPELLDGSGGRLASGGTPVYLNFDVYPANDFSAFGFDFAGAPGQASDEADATGGEGDGAKGGGGDVG